MKLLSFIWVLGLFMLPQSSGSTDVCKHTGSCNECILSSPSCSWCNSKNFTKSGESEGLRCAVRAELLHRGCDEDHIIDPRGSVNVLQGQPLSKSADQKTVIQLHPQAINVKLRPGEQKKFRVQFKRAEGYPIDLYYLMDLSYSMKDDLENVKKLGSDIQKALHKVTKSVHIGFGSFVDKTVLPFVSTVKSKLENPCPHRGERCQPPFSYRHVLSLTSNLTLFQMRVSAENISGNLDAPEGGLDAMLQAAVCTDLIGWRNVTRLLVFASDDVFHTAGDGKLAGIYLPADGHCHLNSNSEYYQSNMYDYPSVGHLAQILTAANIQPIFAVTSSVVSTYQALSDLIPKSAVGELKEDSSNVVNLISEAYNNLSSTINLEHVNLPKGIHISYDSHCSNSSTMGKTQAQCSGVKINQAVSFDVTLWMDKTMCPGGKQSFQLRVLGFSEELKVDVEPLCACACEDEEISSDYCGGVLGNYSCGICSCQKGHSGKQCDCPLEKHNNDKACWDRGPLPCNGHGRCECGRCACDIYFRGDLCQCDDTSCERYEGQLCGGITRGVCNCGTCNCTDGYKGSDCGCSKNTSGCIINGTECSEHGHCECNKCKCNPGYYNKWCSECPECQTICKELTNCAECKAFGKGTLKNNCSSSCPNVNVTLAKAPLSIDNEKLCKEKGEDFITFLVREEGGFYQITVEEKQEAANVTKHLILGLTLGIALIGLIIIVTLRITVEIYDRQEYKRFQKEQSNAQWNELNNPLYKSATTTVKNPNFIE
ncbi:integrin beta-7 [Xenopus laevis]|uniref:Integrin beta n=2 Tax=Xenopus laevis TaxID=8355 RepID=A0A1L8HIP4_XENLA|nr:integrin beta-7 [Xenopus laevis]OCT95911.1 hypothetical protein XELAEV_18013599mg [Xenopus laevis]